MSLNIQTPNGLKKLADKTTEKTIKNALGYTPAKEDDLKTHIGDVAVHVSSSDREYWDGKPNTFQELPDKPNIDDDGSDTFKITDQNGNIIALIDSNGVSSVGFWVGSKSVATKDDVDIIDSYLLKHVNDSSAHFSGDYNDLTNKPLESEDTDDSLSITDDNGNVIFKVDQSGVNSVGFYIKGVSVVTEDILSETLEPYALKDDIQNIDLSGYVTETFLEATLDAYALVTDIPTDYATEDSLNNHINDSSAHFSGDYNDLSNKPLEREDTDNSLSITDIDGYIIFKVDQNGVATTNMTADDTITTQNMIVSGDFESNNVYTNNLQINNQIEAYYGSHVLTLPEKSGTVALLEDIKNVDLSGYVTDDSLKTTLEPYALKDDIQNIDLSGYVTETFLEATLDAYALVTDIPTDYATEDSLNNHISDTSAHFSGDYNDLSNKPLETEDTDNSFKITDPDGYIIFKVDNSGVTTTNLTIDDAINTYNLNVDGDLYSENNYFTNIQVNKTIETYLGSYILTLPQKSGTVALLDDIQNVDLSGYVTEDDLNTTLQSYLTSDSLNGYVTETNLNTTLSSYVKLEDLQTIDLSGYVTQDALNTTLSSYATVEDLESIDLSGYATLDSLNATNTNLTNHINDTSSHFSGDYNDLSNKPLETEETDNSFKITDPDGYIIFELNNQGMFSTNLTIDDTITTTNLVVNGDVEFDQTYTNSLTVYGGSISGYDDGYTYTLPQKSGTVALLDDIQNVNLDGYVTKDSLNITLASYSTTGHTHSNYLTTGSLTYYPYLAATQAFDSGGIVSGSKNGSGGYYVYTTGKSFETSLTDDSTKVPVSSAVKAYVDSAIYTYMTENYENVDLGSY